ncbi:16S rRNA (cytosine(967)-C(5))-methyltransferase RsmB [Alicyclobacillus macrosporangiidus]|uniref:16S rRNA (cytosine(967)-C(5))-methyltransferase n=1 Tax=Alicyclobacillus macrosporangiidus TaxID=392015 RepID=A0A1I7H8F9_9BACL|nr:16S rRNA (cytosine(967)-C(5))-methyltransferase RsmB [Alicyclobacillus macrosporangiidus]SFU56919.1 16S rRNA (cytosine967-C5)-methyltransferase [Alicyclobacillus macrosporangiidus]
MTARARSVALRVLLDIETDGKYANLALQQAFRNAALDDRDKALCTELVYGTVQRRRSLDALLAPYCARPLDDLDRRVLTILRMTVYQLAYLTRVPAYAALNDAVNLCKRTAPRAAGFVNGVLRAFTRDQRSAAERLEEAARAASAWADAVGIRHSYPSWIADALAASLGRERAEAVLAACNDPPLLSLRVNPRRATRDEVLQTLREAGIPASPSQVSEWGIRLGRGVDVEAWPPYRQGAVSVQDEASMLIAPLLKPARCASVMDLCAGLGTKTTQIAEHLPDGARVMACDIHAHKLRLLQESARRLGVDGRVEVVLSDARALPGRPELLGRFDAVLLDAPCSGLGVLRRRPDIRWRRRPEDTAALARLQRELLDAAAALVRPGGVIVYATCTLTRQENDELVAAAVADAGGRLAVEDVRPDLPAAVAARVSLGSAGAWVTPEWFGTDGFFMARLRRTE